MNCQIIQAAVFKRRRTSSVTVKLAADRISASGPLSRNLAGNISPVLNRIPEIIIDLMNLRL